MHPGRGEIYFLSADLEVSIAAGMLWRYTSHQRKETMVAETRLLLNRQTVLCGFKVPS